MMLSARPLIGPPGIFRVWVGAFGVINPPVPRFTIDGTPAATVGPAVFFEVRDKQRQAGSGNSPANHQGVFELQSPGPGDHVVVVSLAGETSSVRLREMPARVTEPFAGGFTMLLASCYYQKNDKGALASLQSRLKSRPDMVLLAGDQVYLDLPLHEDLPGNEPALSRMLGDKYAKHWLSREKQINGLDPLLQLAPTACIPDDHEYWNNAPHFSPWLPCTYTAQSRQMLASAGRNLYEDFQLGGDPASHQGAQRIEVDPLRMILLDTRSDRDPGGAYDGRYGLMSKATEDDLVQWQNDLLNDHRAGKLTIGVLAAGQTLFSKAPPWYSEWADSDLQSYAQFGIILRVLRTVCEAGIPVVFLSGDVHYSTISRATWTKTGQECLFEVVSSPVCQIDGPPTKADPPVTDLDAKRFQTKWVDHYSGNVVLTINFLRGGGSVDMNITLYPLDGGHLSPRALETIRLTPRH
ncbi:hypothetical protein C1X59_18955 [Pseudomonas sp. FW215-R2]|uniref:alkaline phosphatase D family protein n=1 Tax=Pseudomonas TaxID=286 RepID=UPI000C881934|nr:MULTISPECIES: alkaline phosphatase D family protein [Pseudomonas]PMW98921.1 hypothetical protein C1X59_18955 [Pseudomonas sp. FW215-R2]PMX06914.1 hypothetical protein C1X60_22645 [Pseudomonas sp. FW215-L1]PMX24446.1 hypothetical protein C1X57_08375 [Pseudomonas sp. FW215-E1]PNA26416.1 hypothetical protein C1X58_21055 [Pseudomonas sp. FW215-R4]